MKENIKKWIALIMATLILFCMMYSCGKVVNAQVPQSQIVQAHSASWGSYDFEYIFHGKYWSIQDDTGIPKSTLLNPKYFYTNDNVTFNAVSGSDLVMLILNRGLSLVVNPDNALALIQGFFTAIGPNHLDTTNNKYAQGGLYNSSDEFLGYVLNDITGCYWHEITDTSSILTIPSETTNNVYRYNKYVNDSTYPDYVTVYPVTNNTIKNNLYNNAYLTNYENITNQNTFYFGCSYVKPDYKYDVSILNVFENLSSCYLLPYLNSESIYNNFCNTYELTKETNTLEWDEVTEIDESSQYQFYVYDNSDNRLTSYTSYNLSNNNSNVVNSNTTSVTFTSSDRQNVILFGDSYTIYKNSTIKQNIIDNQTYEPDTYTGTNYKDYDVNTDNSINTTIGQIDSSITTNQSIYSDCNNSYYENIDNSTVNTENITNEVTNITNNYYSDNGGGDNPDNPDNPDDNQTLDAILAAILRFFNAIGDIIGTVLAGLVNMISAVLESIAELTSDITNLSDVFSSLLAWIPDPVPQVIGIGLSLVIIAGIIKFIRG